MRNAWVLCLSAGLFCCPLAGQEKADKKVEVELRTVKYQGLKDFILKNRGKVVYLDFWYNT